ncbi:hypothetical protein ACNO8X_22100 [Mycobacterium sp. PDNC021]|uniref:hypothetical protein n=1 Tax=Mycobacterium sp. PDNC021 TaxID=3391399 RepID=UPI003AAE5027
MKEDLEALKRCLHVFTRNASDLAAHIGQFLTSPQIAKEISEDYVNELVRLLHNYLTSVTSVIDSQRVVMRHRWPTERKTERCPTCKQALPTNDGLSEFETEVYSKKLAEAFETGEGVFMTKLRNYCTHYSIPVPSLGAQLSWSQAVPGTVLVNTLQLDRDKLLRWSGWTAPGKAYLKKLPQYFDLAPTIERYVNAAGLFASWFWEQINELSQELIDELTIKGAELMAWYQENVGMPDWFRQSGGEAPPCWNGRRWKLGLRRDRFALGTRGFRLWAVDGHGVVTLEKDDAWTPFQLRYY